ncbi:MAG: hypothetical protein JSU61_01900 [Fidelibacterota bacterium]|nr:MAG: hypothetical protein JSU61_01900 [Candidatus Neomarinimicrobiota bacterium]
MSKIRYDLPKGSDVSRSLYDIPGWELARLMDGYMEPGHHQIQWDGSVAGGREVHSSIYITRQVTPEYSKSIKMPIIQ